MLVAQVLGDDVVVLLLLHVCVLYGLFATIPKLMWCAIGNRTRPQFQRSCEARFRKISGHGLLKTAARATQYMLRPQSMHPQTWRSRFIATRCIIQRNCHGTSSTACVSSAWLLRCLKLKSLCNLDHDRHLE